MTQQTQQANTNQNTTQQQQQQSQTAPWVQSLPAVYNLLNSLNNANTGQTPAQTQAINSLVQGAQGLPNFGGQSADVTSGLLGGDPTGLLKSSLNAYQQSVNPIATESLNPLQNPNIQAALQAAQYNATQANNSVFAGSGRTGGGAQSYALGQGIANAEAPMLLGQYNQNVQNVLGANQGLLSAGQNTSNAITGNQQAGMTAAQNQPGIALAPQLAQLQAAQTQYNLPLSNIAGVQGLTLPIAGLGGQSSGSGSGTGTMMGQTNTTITPSMLQDLSHSRQFWAAARAAYLAGAPPPLATF